MQYFICHLFPKKERQEYLLFLKNLLKDQVYVELAYMTGILPIAKYSAASELNMFVEYNMATRERFSSYFGFSEEEVDKLFQIYSETTIRPRITRHDLKKSGMMDIVRHRVNSFIIPVQLSVLYQITS